MERYVIANLDDDEEFWGQGDFGPFGEADWFECRDDAEEALGDIPRKHNAVICVLVRVDELPAAK